MGVSVAALRVAHDKHYVSDTMAGAGIAILSTELAYWLYFNTSLGEFLSEKTSDLFGKSQAIAFPAIENGGAGVGFALKF